MNWLRALINRLIGTEDAHYKRVEHALAIIIDEQRHIKELIMASKQEVVDSINALGSDLDTDYANIQAEIATLQGSGGTIEASDLDDLKGMIDAARAKTATTLGTIGNGVGGSDIPGTASNANVVVLAAHEQVEAAKTAAKTDDNAPK